MNPSSPDPLEPWLPLLLEGTLPEETAAKALRDAGTRVEDPAVTAHLALHRLLPLALQGDEDPGFVREITARLEASRLDGTPAAEQFVSRVVGRLQPALPFYRRWPVWAAAALVGAAAVVWSLMMPRPGSGGMAGLLGNGGLNLAVPEPVAQLVRSESVQWQSAPPGELMPGTRMSLSQGLVELQFRSGTQLIVEGPADFEISGPNAGILRSGRAVAQVPEAGRGFVLDSPRGRLIDHGTQFGVSVEASGETEVHVLEGLVEARQTGRPEPVLLHGREGLRLSPEGQERLSADDAEFVTEMPPPGQTGAPYVHWALDEFPGGFSENLGKGFPAAETRLGLMNYGEGGSGPGPVPGPFGGALSFDGRDDFAACEWLGIPGSAARTVAFWIQVPADASPRQGFGVVGWGQHSTWGGAWQISPNPLEADGPLGRLRVGTQEGHVIGTRDLRDGQWHHVAVVMYGGAKPNTATHVMFYVDGQLDPASRKKLRDIATDTKRAVHGVWLGRNLGFNGGPEEGQWPGGRFFRGLVDEVFIVGAALNQSQIQRLMRENRLD